MVFLDIHWGTFDEKSFRTVKELTNKGYVSISVCPMHVRERMTDEQKAWLKRLFNDREFVLGQQGLTHKCENCLKRGRVDPSHENYCFWEGCVSESEQEKFIVKGKNILVEELGVIPELYVPPNHLFDLNTLRVVRKLGYSWITNRALINLKPYKIEGLIVVPQGEPEIDGIEQVYIHADRWRGELDLVLNKGLKTLRDVESVDVETNKIKENRRIRVIRYLARDLSKGYGELGFGMKIDAAIVLSELMYDTKFINDAFV